MARRRTRLKVLITTAVTTVVSLISIALICQSNFDKAKAAPKSLETVNVRILGTTDIHGQLNSKDYETGNDYSNGGLARLYYMMEQIRSELPSENVVTVDTGDVLFDYTTEYIFSEYWDEVQPIYKAMKMMGYDAITLGNHEFDYGYEYLLNQLNGSGLRDITVVSNVVDSKTGEHPFLENMLLTRNMITSEGNTVEITIGIIGQTIPTLTSKTHSYGGILKTQDMVENAKIQAAKLKEMGADIIIAVSHTGFGPENPEPNFKNVAYALTKIPEIDVVVAGHEHNLFPTTDMTSPYYSLPNVDKKTYLVNGKNVIMAGDRGRAIGVVDLTLRVIGNNVEIINRSSELKFITASNTVENKEIAGLFGKFEKHLLEYSNDIIGELDKDQIIQNYFGMLGDNYAIQLLNDSKISYVLKHVHTKADQYKNYPIVAASTYASFGVNSIDDYVKIVDKFTESDLSLLQPYNNYLYIYEITGKELKEWLEWSASAYETTSYTAVWKDATMSKFMKETKLKSLISEDWLNDWSNFYIFDGIEYEINPSVEPRYDISGNRISDNNRVQSITYNGQKVTDDMVFLLATDKITKPTEANSGVEKKVVLAGFNRSQSILGKYLKMKSANGSILPHVDYNWKVDFQGDYKFIVKAPYYAHDLVLETPWYEEYLGEVDQYRYYVASYPDTRLDTISPHIVLAQTKTDKTGSHYPIAVNATDMSEIKYLKYIKGDYDSSYTGWIFADNIKNNSFTVHDNGLYTVYAEDYYGNRSSLQINVDNISDELLGTPTVDNYTNRKTKISGIAEPGTTIVIEAETGTYETAVPSSGKYSYPLPSQPSGSEVVVYAKDEEKGLFSERVSVTVKRTGPNQPRVNSVLNTTGFITGNTNDSDATVVAISGDKVFVSDQGGKELYLNASEIYNPYLKIVETKVEIYDNGYFIMFIPPLNAGSAVEVYNLDHVSRRSMPVNLTVEEAGPNAPVVYEVSNIEKGIKGYVPGNGNEIFDITLLVNNIIYKTKTDIDGKFSIDLDEQLYAGQILTVYATESIDGKARNSYQLEVVVKDIEDYVRTNSVIINLNRVTTKSNYILGTYTDGGKVYIAIAQGEGTEFINQLYTAETNSLGRIEFKLEEKLPLGAKIYVMSRFEEGRILLAGKTEVLPGRPDIPSLVKEVTNNDKQVQVIANQDCEVVLTIGSKKYVSSEYEYDEANDRYIYTFETDRDISGTELTIVATNVTGTSDVFTAKLVKVAPDAPDVNKVKEGDTLVTGKIELLDYIPPVSDNEDNEGEVKEEIDADFENAPDEVAKTQTRVYAQINKKVYKGTIDKNGNFSIEIPPQKEGTVIRVWGTNKAGRGPLIKITVVK